MSHPRLYCFHPIDSASNVTLDGARAHYLGHVLRAKLNDKVILFDGRGGEYVAVVTSIDKKKVVLQIEAFVETRTESPLRVTLVQSLIRGERMDYCVQKATELGVSRIAPVFTERTVIKLTANRAAKRVDHWLNVAISACEQSGRASVPEISDPISLMSFIESLNSDKTKLLVLDPWANARPLHTLDKPADHDVTVCIGPEGGFSDHEIAYLKEADAQSVTCGPRILRSETAGVIAVAACQMAWGDW